MDREPDYFADDVDPATVEGDEAEAEAVAEVAAELAPEPEPEPEPTPEPEPVVQPGASQSIGGIPTPPEDIPLAVTAERAGSKEGGVQYPTEDPGDQDTVWSPRPGLIGSHRRGFRKIR